VTRLKEYLFKTRQPLLFNVPDIIKISIVSLFEPIVSMFKQKPQGEVLKKGKNNKIILF